MAFSYQKDVALYNNKAIAGDRANQQVVIYTPTNFTTASAVKVGGFVWRDTTNPETQIAAAGSDAPLGFMERVQNFPNYTIGAEGTLEIPAGCEVNVAVKGDFYVVADGAVSVGDTVYADTTDGSVTFTSSGTTEDSGFVAFTSASASGELVIITKR